MSMFVRLIHMDLQYFVANAVLKGNYCTDGGTLMSFIFSINKKKFAFVLSDFGLD